MCNGNVITDRKSQIDYNTRVSIYLTIENNIRFFEITLEGGNALFIDRIQNKQKLMENYKNNPSFEILIGDIIRIFIETSAEYITIYGDNGRIIRTFNLSKERWILNSKKHTICKNGIELNPNGYASLLDLGFQHSDTIEIVEAQRTFPNNLCGGLGEGINLVTLKAKDVYTGKIYEIENVDLDISIRDIVDSLVSAGMIPPAPLGVEWTIVDKNII